MKKYIEVSRAWKFKNRFQNIYVCKYFNSKVASLDFLVFIVEIRPPADYNWIVCWLYLRTITTQESENFE